MATPSFYKRGLAVFGALTVLATATVAGLKIGSTGTTIASHYRSTLSVNPDSIAANGATTTVVTVTGAVAGSHCGVNATAGDLLSTTSTVHLACRAGTDSATVFYRNTSSTAAFDAGTSTLSVQVWGY